MRIWFEGGVRVVNKKGKGMVREVMEMVLSHFGL